MPADTAGPPNAQPFRYVDRLWAVSVAEDLLWAYRSLTDPSLIIDECWLTAEFALYIRHTRGDVRLGVRFGRLGINPTTEAPPSDSGQEGVYLFHSIYDTPHAMKLTDHLGYDWWGDDPADEPWSDAVAHERMLTLRL